MNLGSRLEVGPSISTISDTELIPAEYPSLKFIPTVSIDNELLFSLTSGADTLISGSDAKAGGGARESDVDKDTG